MNYTRVKFDFNIIRVKIWRARDGKAPLALNALAESPFPDFPRAPQPDN